MTDGERCGRPLSTRTEGSIAQVSELIQNNCRLSTREIAEEIGIDHMTVFRILTEDLKKRCICSVWVPHELTEQQKTNRVLSATSIKKKLEEMGTNASSLYGVQDETWILHHAVGTKAENKAWIGTDEKRPRVVRPNIADKKSMLLVAFTCSRRFSVQALPQGKTVDSEAFIQFVRKTGDKWRTLRSHPIKLSEICWQMDNARPHKSRLTTQFFTERRIQTLWQSPYSPDLNLCDRFLFDWLKRELRKEDFTSHEQVEASALQHLRSLTETTLSRELQRLLDHCDSIIENMGDYVTK